MQGSGDASRFRYVTEGYSTWLPDGAPQGRSGGEEATAERRYVGISATFRANGEPVTVNRYMNFISNIVKNIVKDDSEKYGIYPDRGAGYPGIEGWWDRRRNA
jgi:hypothetical protein